MIAFSRFSVDLESILLLLEKINLAFLSAKCLGYNLRKIVYT